MTSQLWRVPCCFLSALNLKIESASGKLESSIICKLKRIDTNENVSKTSYHFLIIEASKRTKVFSRSCAILYANASENPITSRDLYVEKMEQEKVNQ